MLLWASDAFNQKANYSSQKQVPQQKTKQLQQQKNNYSSQML
jgi:hypothetical protein